MHSLCPRLFLFNLMNSRWHTSQPRHARYARLNLPGYAFKGKELLFFAVLEGIHTESFAAAQKSLQGNAAFFNRLPSGADRGAYPQLLETFVRGSFWDLFV